MDWILPSPQIPNHQYDCIWNKEIIKVRWGDTGGALLWWHPCSCTKRERPWELLSLPCEDSREVSRYKLGRELLQEPNLPAPWTWTSEPKDAFLFVRPPGWGAQTDEYSGPDSAPESHLPLRLLDTSSDVPGAAGGAGFCSLLGPQWGVRPLPLYKPGNIGKDDTFFFWVPELIHKTWLYFLCKREVYFFLWECSFLY